MGSKLTPEQQAAVDAKVAATQAALAVANAKRDAAKQTAPKASTSK